MPTETEHLIHGIYRAFNERNIDGAFAFMADDVSWPKASEGGRVTGKAAIRAYWSRQWQQFDPHVTPLSVTVDDTGTIRVRVHQQVRNLNGDMLSDSEVIHLYTLSSGLVQRMDLGDAQAGTAESASAAFSAPRSA